MIKIIIYGSGLILVAIVVGLLLFLTFENAVSGEAVFSSRFGVFNVSGPASIFVNLGILGMVSSFLSFMIYLFSRNPILLRVYTFAWAFSGFLIFIGWVWSQA